MFDIQYIRNEEEFARNDFEEEGDYEIENELIIPTLDGHFAFIGDNKILVISDKEKFYQIDNSDCQFFPKKNSII